VRYSIDTTGARGPFTSSLALACCAQAEPRSVPHLTAYGEAKAEAQRALAMDDSCADAQALGTVLSSASGDWVASNAV